MRYLRSYDEVLDVEVKPGRVLVLYGPRRTGKTCLVKHYLDGYAGRVYRGSGDDSALRALMADPPAARLRELFGAVDLVFLDEAQKIPGIGAVLKLLVDTLPTLKVIATSSSSFDLAHQVGEPLTGRKKTLRLYPMSLLELKTQFGGIYCEERLESLLIYGSYPEALTLASTGEKEDYLVELRDSALYRDILELDSVRNSKKIADLLRLIAFQVGREVSYRELGTQLGLSYKSVERYLDLLEKAFVLVHVRGFSRNLRKEVTKTSRYYFVDNGILNAVIGRFQALPLRDDVGALWENFLFMERLKRNVYLRINAQSYFWCTYDQQEIDLVEEESGKLKAFEFKFSPRKQKTPRAWAVAYPDAPCHIISRENYLGFCTDSSDMHSNAK